MSIKDPTKALQEILAVPHFSGADESMRRIAQEALTCPHGRLTCWECNFPRPSLIELPALAPFVGSCSVEGEERTNTERIERALLALRAWLQGEVLDEGDIQDCISDLLHLAHAWGIPIAGMLSSAVDRFVEETNV